MKVFVASIFALLVGSSTAVAQDISAKDFDLACAVTASAVVASSPKGAVERDSAMWLWSFYLGRLSGRDDKTFWAMVIKGRLAELREKLQQAKDEGLLGRARRWGRLSRGDLRGHRRHVAHPNFRARAPCRGAGTCLRLFARLHLGHGTLRD